MKKLRILGVATSLRNTRWGSGGRNLIDRLHGLDNYEQLISFLQAESEIKIDNNLSNGFDEGKTFSEIYKTIAKSNREHGLSNSETALAAALWAAAKEGAEIEHIALSDHISTLGEIRDGQDGERLKTALLRADGVIIAGPVYFGDRGSLAESLIDFIGRDTELRAAMAGRLYGGIAVGAKRNGGQETTLIYQMADMLNMGFLAIGNDSETTAQYGGTCLAGDIGTMHRDAYGLATSMGVGRRMAKVLQSLSHRRQLSDAPRALLLVLQDVDGVASRTAERLAQHLHAQSTIINVASLQIMRCIACDICPTHIGLDGEYRCVIKSNNDDFEDIHATLLDHDMIIPIVATALDRSRIVSNYHEFVERSRYIRRSDYIWSDLLVAPVTLSENPGFDTYSMRQMTSFIRHHTVMSKPATGQVVDGEVMNFNEVAATLENAARMAARLAAGRYTAPTRQIQQYNPVGYILSAAKNVEEETTESRQAAQLDRRRRLERASERC